jgi:hypothetical protein
VHQEGLPLARVAYQTRDHRATGMEVAKSAAQWLALAVGRLLEVRQLGAQLVEQWLVLRQPVVGLVRLELELALLQLEPTELEQPLLGLLRFRQE